MFDHLYQWLQDISFYLILVTAISYALPVNSYRKYIRFFTGLVLILMLLAPIRNLFGLKEFEVESLMEEYKNEYEWNQDIQVNKEVEIEVEDIVIGP